MDLTHKCIIIKKSVFLKSFSCINVVSDSSFLSYLLMEYASLFLLLSFRAWLDSLSMMLCKTRLRSDQDLQACWNAQEACLYNILIEFMSVIQREPFLLSKHIWQTPTSLYKLWHSYLPIRNLHCILLSLLIWSFS